MKPAASLISFALLFALCVTASYAKPKDDPNAPPKKDPTIVGAVLKVEGTNITIKTRGKEGGDKVIATDAKTEFTLNGKATTIEKIKAGYELVVTPAATATAPALKVAASNGKKPKKKDA